MIYLKQKKGGFLVLTMVLLVCAVVLIISTGLLLRSISDVRESTDSENSLKARSAVNACGEYALGQMVSSSSATTTATNWGYAGGLSVAVGSETCYIYPVTASGTAKLIKASSTVSSFTKKILIEVATNSPSLVISSWQEVADF